MTKHRSIAARVARLERISGAHRPPRVIYSVYDRDDGAVIGYGGLNSPSVMRQPGETLAALQDRALATLSNEIIVTIYADEPSESEEDYEVVS